MRIHKTIATLLAVAMILLAILGGLFCYIGMTTPQMFKKICYFICVALVLVLIGLVAFFMYLSKDKEKNFFLYQRSTGKNISVDELRFSMVNEKMSAYISVNFENSEKLWMGDAWSVGDRFGANGEYRGLVAYKMLFDLADHDDVEQWDYFAEAPAETVVGLCEALACCGDRNLAQKLTYIRSNCGVEIAPLRSLVLGNKKYLASKMVGFVRRNIEWFYYT